MKLTEIEYREPILRGQELQAYFKQKRDFIEKNCEQFLKDINYNVANYQLYRGSYNFQDRYLNGVGVVTVRQDRKPLDTRREIHDKLNKVFADLGFSGNRSNTIFCTGKYKQASNYGSVWMVFPIGEYSVIWSKDNDDLFYAIGKLKHNLSRLPQYKYSSPEHIIPDYEELTPFIKAHYQEGNILEAIKSNNEIMVKCDRYVVISETVYFDVWKD